MALKQDQINAHWEGEGKERRAVVTRRSPVTGKENTMRLDITQAEFTTWIKGTPIQRAAPRLNADEREFLITGIASNEEWDAATLPTEGE
jgi:hypothetical protein